MSYALVESVLGEGRYRVKLDYGDAQRKALINANEMALADITFKMEVAREAVLAAEILEAAANEQIVLLIQQLVVVQVVDPALAKVTQALLDEAKIAYGKLVASHAPLRRQHATLKAAHANGVQRRIKWNALETIAFREVWCADYSTDASGYVATIDIPGDPTLVLLAPGSMHIEAEVEFSTPRHHQVGDGTVSTARKQGTIVALQAQLKPLAAESGDLTNNLIPQAVALEANLKGEVASAQLDVVNNPTPDNRVALSRAKESLDAQRLVLQGLRDRKNVLVKQIDVLNVQLDLWNRRAASDSPNYGDGRYQARDLGSPEQTFFNAAIFPGWQKWKPTYRWGTITALDVDANTASVTLGDATSTAGPPAPRLNVNQAAQLVNVPIRYMTCDAEAFAVGDNVVIGFGTITVTEGDGSRQLAWSSSQRWSEPVIIGFVDNPLRCIPWPSSVDLDLVFNTVAEDSPGRRRWTNIVDCPPDIGRTPERLEYYVVSRPIAPTATHTLQLAPPVFSAGDVTAGADEHFTVTANGGNFGVLWSGDSSAFGFDTASCAGNCEAHVPGETNVATSTGTTPGAGTEAAYVKIYVNEAAGDAYSQNTVSYHDIGFPVPGGPDGSGAWIHTGAWPSVGSVPVSQMFVYDSAPDELLHTLNAMPTISVARNRNGTTKEYEYASASTFTEGAGRRVWRLVFNRPQE